MKGYFYLHKNTKDLIEKDYHVVESEPEYFNSPFVEKYWLYDDAEYESKWTIILEASVLGANERSIVAILNKFHYNTVTELIRVLDKTLKPTQQMKEGMDRILEIKKIPKNVFSMITSVIWALERGECSMDGQMIEVEGVGGGMVAKIKTGFSPEGEDEADEIIKQKMKELLSKKLKFEKPEIELDEEFLKKRRRINFGDLEDNQN